MGLLSFDGCFLSGAKHGLGSQIKQGQLRGRNNAKCQIKPTKI